MAKTIPYWSCMFMKHMSYEWPHLIYTYIMRTNFSKSCEYYVLDDKKAWPKHKFTLRCKTKHDCKINMPE